MIHDKNRTMLHVKIAERFERIAGGQPRYTRAKLMMDLDACSDWNLLELLEMPDGDFGHDVAGLMNHIDRSTYPGTIPGWFSPRCGLIGNGSRKEQAQLS
jgi:hypothetical protein